jgi:hypothetical protein
MSVIIKKIQIIYMMKNIIKSVMSFGLVAALIAVAPLASANYSINSLSNDCQTVTIANHTTGVGAATPCWTNTSLNANVGDVINVAIYYNNSGTTNADNVTFKLTDPQNQTISSNGTVSMTGSILVGGQVVKQGTVTLNVTGGASQLVLGNVMQYNQTTQANTPISGGPSILTSSGLAFGSIAPGWANQGVIKVSFTILGNSNPGPTGIAPNVSTSAYSGWNSTAGNVTLNGTYASNGYDTTTSFEYRMNGGSWTTVGTTNRGTGAGSFSYPLTNLSSGTYEYKALASNTYGSVEGSIFTFTINSNTTLCPSGSYWNGTTCVNNVVTCPAGYYLSGSTCIQNVTYCPSGYYLSGGTCIQNITSCPSGYYLSGNTCIQNIVNQNCGYNQYWNGSYCVNNVTTCPAGYYLSGNSCVQNVVNQNCGYNQYWNGSYCVNNVTSTTGLPTVSTLGTISVGGNVVAVDGYYTANGCDAYTSFKYGTTQSLGNTTGEVNRGNNTGSMAQSISGLLPNTTYYYQASVRNCVGTAVGSIRQFTTVADTTNDTVIIRNVTNTTTIGGGGSSFIKLMIDNHRDIIRGTTNPIAYDVSWQNLTKTQLNKLVLEVNFPTQMSILDTDHGSIERNRNSVVYQIDTLAPLESGTMTITTQITGTLRDNDPVVAQAIMAFENPKTTATENAIAYDADQYQSAIGNSVLGASLFGLDFLPTSLAGWLLIILILLLIIILAHSYITRQRAATVVVQNGHVPANIPVDTNAGATGNDYIVYRPTPKQ